jgi:hypothetical protein
MIELILSAECLKLADEYVKLAAQLRSPSRLLKNSAAFANVA